MTIAVLGAGAAGSVVGYFLQKGGDNVWLVDTNAEHVDAINKTGLQIELNEKYNYGINYITVPMKATSNPEDIGICDIVIILTKTPDTRTAITNSTALFGPTTIVLTLQNGIGTEDLLLEFFPKTYVCGGNLNLAAELKGPGMVKATLTHRESVQVYCASGRRPKRLLNLTDHLNKTEFKASYSENVLAEKWHRALINISTCFLAAITEIPATMVATVEPGRDLIERLIRETVTVANAVGVDIDVETEVNLFFTNTISLIDEMPSCWYDIQAGRETEIEVINGAVSRIARRCEISTPVNDTIANIVRIIQSLYNQRCNKK